VAYCEQNDFINRKNTVIMQKKSHKNLTKECLWRIIEEKEEGKRFKMRDAG
jgi:hypothetical protein